MTKTTSARANVVVLKQMLNLIPRGVINHHALETGVDGGGGDVVSMVPVNADSHGGISLEGLFLREQDFCQLAPLH